MILSLDRAGDRLVAAGERGLILFSDDHGRNWKQAATPTSVTLTAVRFATKLDGWAAGHMGVVLSTNDGGATWRRELDGIGAAALAPSQTKQSAAATPNDPRAVARVKGVEQLVRDGPDKPFLAMSADDPKHVLVVGAFGIAFAGEDARYLAGERGLFLRSENGEPFTAIKVPYQRTFFGALKGPEHVLILFGLQGTVLPIERPRRYLATDRCWDRRPHHQRCCPCRWKDRSRKSVRTNRHQLRRRREFPTCRWCI
jgi:hypothetical protein